MMEAKRTLGWMTGVLLMMQLGSTAAAQQEAGSVYEATDTAEETLREDLFGDGRMRIIFRLDDIGFCHAANLALRHILEAGGPASAVSVLVNTPWLDEAVDLLREYPAVSVGVHTCLNSEWVPYRWGPVSPVADVPSLVDSWGKFFGTRQQFLDNGPDLDEIEKEIRAQIDLALRKGLRVSYMDHHMSTAVSTDPMRERFERIAGDYGLAVSRWFGEIASVNIYSVTPELKTQRMLDQIGALSEPGTYLVVCHVGMNTPELAALEDVHTFGLRPMAPHRDAEMRALADPRLQRLLAEKNIEVIGYDLLRERFVDRMRSPDSR